MKIMKAHEAPIELMQYVQNLTDYDYALVHHFESHPEYYNFFKTALTLNREVILDNSIFELKTAFDPDQFAEWIIKLEPTLYVVPDVLENGYETMLNFETWKDTHADHLPGGKMGTVQGPNLQEIADCYRYMSEHADCIAISFDMSYYQGSALGRTVWERRCAGRKKLISDLITMGLWNWEKPHHLLGCSMAKEFSYYKAMNVHNIRSVDTSNPVIAAISGLKYNGTLGSPGLPYEIHLADNEDIIDKKDFTTDQLELLEYNIRQFNHILND